MRPAKADWSSDDGVIEILNAGAPQAQLLAANAVAVVAPVAAGGGRGRGGRWRQWP